VNPAEPFLLGVVEAALPTQVQTLLLKACVLPGDDGRVALETWLRQPGAIAPDAIGGSLAQGRLLGPLLLWSIERHGVQVPAALLTYLRAAAAREDRRAAAVREIAHGIFALLARDGISSLALKGAALAEMGYPHPGLRHTHDVDVMVEARHLGHAADLIGRSGFVTEPEHRDANGVPRLFTHPSGLPVALHRWIFSVQPFAEPLEEDVWRRAVPGPGRSRALSPADALLHVCVHAMMHPQRSTLVWVSDAWFMLERGPAPDWSTLMSAASRCGAALPLFAALRYLARELDAGIPAEVMAEVSRLASESTREASELALGGARPGGAGEHRIMWSRARGPRERAFVARWVFLPTSAYVAWLRGGSPTTPLFRWYVRRYLGGIRRRIFRRRGGA
jgi:hypothetical protein